MQVNSENARQIDAVIARLGAPDREQRFSAAVELAKHKDTTAVPALCVALEDSDASVRGRVAVALGSIGDARAVDPLMRALNRCGLSDGWILPEIVQALREIKAPIGPVISSLIAILGQFDSDGRSRAADALGAFAEPSAIEPLVALLGDPDIDEIFERALGNDSSAYSLRRPTSQPQADKFIIRSSVIDRKVQASAARALGKLGARSAVNRLVELLRTGDNYVKPAAAEALGELRDPCAVEPLIAALRETHQSNSHSDLLRRSAAAALGQIRDARAVEPLIVALEDRESTTDVKKAILTALGSISDARAVSKIDKFLEYPEAARALERIGGSDAEAALVRAINIHWTNEELIASLLRLKQIKATGIQNLLRAAFGEERLEAITALAELNEPRLFDVLTETCRYAEFDISRVIAKAVGHHPIGVAVLRRALDDPSLQLGAAMALRCLEPHATDCEAILIEALESCGCSYWAEKRARNIATALLNPLGTFDQEVVTLVVATFRIEKDEHSHGCGEYGGKGHLAAIKQAEALHNLGSSADSRLAGLLHAKLSDAWTEIRLEAADALRGIGDLRCVDPLIAILTYRRQLGGSDEAGKGHLDWDMETKVKEKAHEALKDILQSRAAEVQSQALSRLAELHSVSVAQRSPRPAHDLAVPYVLESMDCSFLSKLALQEISKRS